MNTEHAEEQLKKIFEIGRKCGMGHAMFLNFGTLLGCVREKRLIPDDDDTDVGIRSDWITRDQERQFYDMLKAEQMFEYRERKEPRPDNQRFLWFSLKSQLGGTKSCIWFCFPWRKHLYHCKGKRWLRKIGLKPQVMNALPNKGQNLLDWATIMKGNSLRFYEKLIEVPFLGEKFNIPHMPGSALTEYYGSWAIKAKGSSKRHRLVLIKDWFKKSSWMVLKEG